MHVEKNPLIEKHIRLTRDVLHPKRYYDILYEEEEKEEEDEEMRETQTVLQKNFMPGRRVRANYTHSYIRQKSQPRIVDIIGREIYSTAIVKNKNKNNDNNNNNDTRERMRRRVGRANLSRARLT